ncbi:DUF676-domain-containing protein [Paraphaeosphaeria sporulosa]|uniref:DUF676-domain-containing protein n=1 Tax=Paraphaeosphaeria sporulosa TaxID=1460663 RepID=A0A177CK32_9PLEO|nr:DUF676-domain-containing protein [Paraphaeosphaeria sporulosa]OAG07875.1 DUF676-domain-containing protein [Paraphaeosphaeria sporulosa]
MLLTPRTYALAQIPDAGCSEARSSYFLLSKSRTEQRNEQLRARSMLLLHQTGSVRVGEVVRYTVTYTPSQDRILPSPNFLHVRIRNTSAIPLRAAYLHGPYTIHVAAYPSTFNPNKKVEAPKKEGVPEFEPNLKAGGSWSAKLTVPEHIRETGGNREQNDGAPQSATWIIEIASQIIFSQSASIGYELLVARDEKSLDLGFMAITGNSHGVPGQVQDHQQGKQSHKAKHAANQKGVYSKAVKLVVDDTTSLWNKPELPEINKEEAKKPTRYSTDTSEHASEEPQKQRKIHLVILTHGLHSNLGADMLYLKESIDATARQAREDRRKRRRQERQAARTDGPSETSTAQLSGGQEDISPADDSDDDDEEVIVRGFDKNVIKTERGVQYLGKRLAKHVLELTYPDQPYLPLKKPKIKTPFSPIKDKSSVGLPAHEGSSIHHQDDAKKDQRAYKFTSISFVGHSLGGVVQTYAIAYIYKHSPEFFEKIKPINFIAMASPFLGLSNENPMYVKFALDFGLVGRTGQDLGLTWRAPTLARSGWTAMVSGLGGQSQSQQKQDDPGSKPLLRILPSGPAHVVLRMFRNRTVYSNVVNDGIVPLRTSCLLFLDWRGLGKVEKARRENGLVGTVAAWGFGQLIGSNTSPNPSRVTFSSDDQADGTESPSFSGDDTVVPQPGADVANEDEEAQAAAEPSANQWLDEGRRSSDGKRSPPDGIANSSTIYQLWNYIRPSGKHTAKDKKMFTRSQTIAMEQEEADAQANEASSPEQPHQQRKRPQATRGDSMVNDPSHSARPPKTTIFESASDLIAPPVPETSWIIDPSTRARTIFHDRIYHPEDIPPPPARKRNNQRSFSGDSMSSQASAGSADETSGLRVEEKIARAYHKDLSWRKVLVRLEPDAHNNIIVRRMFANAYGWPVVKHLCDTHFADTYAANERDEREPAIDRAKGINVPVREDGEHVKGQESAVPPIERTDSELREVADELAPLKSRVHQRARGHTTDSVRSKDSAAWDDMYFEGTSDEDDDEDDRNAIQRFLQLPPQGRKSPRTPDERGTSQAEISDFLSTSPKGIDMQHHRGLGSSPAPSHSKPARQREPDSLESMGGVPPPILGTGRLTSSPPQTPTVTASGNISKVGLGKGMDVTSPASAGAQDGRARSGSGGVSEQVARLSYFPDGGMGQGG